jgi:hypothetical protein
MELVAHIVSNLSLIKANGADTISLSPKMSAPISPFELKMEIE